MAEERNKPEKEAGVSAPKSESGDSGSESAQQQEQRIQLQIDDSSAVTAYANFFRVARSPEELIIDLGVTPQPFGTPNQSIRMSHRIIMNYYTAKRLLHVLQLTIQHHEATFGVLETDIRKRARPEALIQPPSQQPGPPAGP